MRHFLLAIHLKDDCSFLVLSAGKGSPKVQEEFPLRGACIIESGWEGRGRKRSQDLGSEMFMAHAGESGVEAWGVWVPSVGFTSTQSSCPPSADFPEDSTAFF